MDHNDALENEVNDARGPAVTSTLDGVHKFGPQQFVQQVMRILGGKLTDKQANEFAALLEDASFWVEHDQKSDNSKNYFFCLAAGNLAKAEGSGDDTDVEQAWKLYSRFNPYTGNKEGPGA